MSNEKKSERAFGVSRTPAGWILTEYQIEGARVVGRKTTEPDLRVLALERLSKEISVFWEDDD